MTCRRSWRGWGGSGASSFPCCSSFRYLNLSCPEAIRIVSEHLEISASEVLRVATFYNQFASPRRRHPG